tara:strand:+ start:3401 stop:3571 length:171 start_codon:yes stop_codon:yes gene_type:complete
MKNLIIKRLQKLKLITDYKAIYYRYITKIYNKFYIIVVCKQSNINFVKYCNEYRLP